MAPPAIVTHGGADHPQTDSDGPEAACRRGMEELRTGGDDAAVRAVVEAAIVLEDDPRFNAGTGANLRLDGSIQQDAIVATSDGRIGAVACLDSTRNPVRVARRVMESPHLMVCGDGATRFARQNGLPAHDCTTPAQVERWRESIARLKRQDFHPSEVRWRGHPYLDTGTIGAVARDAEGRFAVSCSTGGTSLMLRGRVGDTPIFGAGVMVGPYGAVCATGHGEEIVRNLCCMRCYQRMERGETAQAAADAVVAAFPEPWSLGLIAVGREACGRAATAGGMASAVLEG